MAQIIWKPRAIRQLNAIIDYSVPDMTRDWYLSYLGREIRGGFLCSKEVTDRRTEKRR